MGCRGEKEVSSECSGGRGGEIKEKDGKCFGRLGRGGGGF